jgi:hypothetical protein
MAAIADVGGKSLLQLADFRALVVTLLTTIKNISMEPSTLEQLAQCRVFQTLIPVLDCHGGAYDKVHVASPVDERLGAYASSSLLAQLHITSTSLNNLLNRCALHAHLFFSCALHRTWRAR